MDPILIIIISTIGFIIITGVMYGYFVSKGFRMLLIKIDQTESEIDVALTKRLDALHHVILDVKKDLKPDSEFMTMLHTIRQPGHQSPLIEKQVFGQQILEMIEALFALIKKDEILGKTNRIQSLLEILSEAETNLETRKLAYNNLVADYNKKVVTFPTNIIAKKRECVKRELFESDEFTLKNGKDTI